MKIAPARVAAFDILLRVERDAAYSSSLLAASAPTLAFAFARAAMLPTNLAPLSIAPGLAHEPTHFAAVHPSQTSQRFGCIRRTASMVPKCPLRACTFISIVIVHASLCDEFLDRSKSSS